MREPEDTDDTEFEAAFRIRLEPSNLTFDLPTKTFRFAPDKQLYRFTIASANFLPVRESGVVYFESRVRRAGEEEWKSQEFPIFVNVTDERTLTTQATDEDDANN